MDFPVKMAFPLANGAFVMDLAQTPKGRVPIVKVISARNQDELDKLQKIGWKVQE